MINGFINIHKDLTLEGISLHEWVSSDAESLERYKDTILLMDREDARSLIIALTPLVLRVQLNVVLYDVNGQGVVYSE